MCKGQHYLASFDQASLEFSIEQTCPICHKCTRMNHDFCRVFSHLTLKHRFISAFSNHPTNCGKTKMIYLAYPPWKHDFDPSFTLRNIGWNIGVSA
jgi:hypothetical protein